MVYSWQICTKKTSNLVNYPIIGRLDLFFKSLENPLDNILDEKKILWING